MKPEKRRKKTRHVILFTGAVCGVLLAVLFFVRSCAGGPDRDLPGTDSVRDLSATVREEHQDRMGFDISDSGISLGDSVVPPVDNGKDPGRIRVAARDSLSVPDLSAGGWDTLMLHGDDEGGGPDDPCAADTVAPWVYPDPSGGLHRAAVKLKLVADKPCAITWKFDGEEAWRSYDGGIISVESTATLLYQAVDGCGNRLEARRERYVMDLRDMPRKCPSDMELVEIGETIFCIDRYEWPNRKGARPRSYVSIYHAMDSCAAAGKRLCSAGEWKRACSGPDGWAYPYGRHYEKRACVTQDTGVFLSGSKPECRGYFDVYDMSGNLLEWTATRSAKNERFYDVMGGFWESGSESGCFHGRYSYYPQNRHNPVGFRCCKDAGGVNGKK